MKDLIGVTEFFDFADMPLRHGLRVIFGAENYSILKPAPHYGAHIDDKFIKFWIDKLPDLEKSIFFPYIFQKFISLKDAAKKWRTFEEEILQLIEEGRLGAIYYQGKWYAYPHSFVIKGTRKGKLILNMKVVK